MSNNINGTDAAPSFVQILLIRVGTGMPNITIPIARTIVIRLILKIFLIAFLKLPPSRATPMVQNPIVEPIFIMNRVGRYFSPQRLVRIMIGKNT